MNTPSTITINGRAIEFEKGQTILEICRGAGVTVPTLCHDERLKPYGGCRLCIVEIKGMPRPLASCTTPAKAGMEVTTETPV